MGLRPMPRQEGVALLNLPPKGEALWDLSLSVRVYEEAIHDVSTSAQASSHTLTELNGSKGPWRLADVQKAEPSGGVWGETPSYRSPPNAPQAR